MVDAPDTLGRMLGAESFSELRHAMGQTQRAPHRLLSEALGTVQDGILDPKHAAETYWQLAHQHRSAWTFEIDLRPFSELPWWNNSTAKL